MLAALLTSYALRVRWSAEPGWSDSPPDPHRGRPGAARLLGARRRVQSADPGGLHLRRHDRAGSLQRSG